MSLILEALRKSEQQRRLGEPPTLGSENAWAARRWHGAPARAPRWPWIVLLLLLGAVAGGVAWWRKPATDAAAVADAPPVPRPTPAATGPDATAPGTAAVAPVQAPAIVAAPATPEIPTPSTTAVPGAPIAPSIQERLDAPTPSPDGEYPEVPPPAERMALQAVAPPPSPTAPAMPVEAAPARAPDAGTPPAAATPAPAASRSSAPAGDVPLVYALPLATRQSLPPLRMSMHVWNADPARRFVILGDSRAAEGESAGDGLTVVEIRRDGTVLDFRGTRFLLPRSGY